MGKALESLRKQAKPIQRTPVKAIRAKCLECCCEDTKAVKECDITSCAIWEYRMGKRPKREKV